LGFAILFAASKSSLRSGDLFAVSLLAASFKFLDAWIFALPMIDKQILNPATAIACQGLAAAALMKFSGDGKNPARLFASLSSMAALSMMGFNLISYVGYGWATNHTMNPLNSIFVQFPATSILSAAVCTAYAAAALRVKNGLGLAWQAASAAALAASAVTVNLLMH
ncbi:MAG TPA: hypothetical protein PLT05_07365, partial [bacterium]|nr:hypothetical protein [bacterium]